VKVSRYIARRYFFSKNSSNAVNIISGISLSGILVGTAALIVVLSAFNGLEQMVRGFYNDFDPDLKITPREGKFFDPDELREHLSARSGIRFAEVLEERVLLAFRQKEYIATLKGVDSNYRRINALEKHLLRGHYRLHMGGADAAVLGAGVAYYLGYSHSEQAQAIHSFAPVDYQGTDPRRAFKEKLFYGSGVFSIQPGFDEKYVISSLRAMREFLELPGQVSALEIALPAEAPVQPLQEELQAQFGDRFRIQNRDEQQALFFKVLKTEGLFTFLIFALILAIATLTLAGSLTMLMLEKRRDLFTYWALGISLRELKQIFLYNGLLIAGMGGLGGLVLGSVVVALQQYFGLVRLGAGYAVDAYPVLFRPADLLLVTITIMGLALSVSWLTARRISLRMLQNH